MTGPRGAPSGPQSDEQPSAVVQEGPDGPGGSETVLGPLVAVLGHRSRDDADRIVAADAGPRDGITAWRYLGLGWALPDSWAPDGMWLHVYATTRPSRLDAALAALED